RRDLLPATLLRRQFPQLAALQRLLRVAALLPLRPLRAISRGLVRLLLRLDTLVRAPSAHPPPLRAALRQRAARNRATDELVASRQFVRAMAPRGSQHLVPARTRAAP